MNKYNKTTTINEEKNIKNWDSFLVSLKQKIRNTFLCRAG